jgi:protoporphyrinogen oxidase
VFDADVVVLGAGPAGVGAAYRAARDGHAVVLLERAERPGGAAGSFRVAGQRVDFGSHRLHPSTDPRILAELQALLGGDLQRRRRHGRIRLAGRWIAFPLRPADLARRLPPAFAAAATRDALIGWTRRPSGDTFGEVLRAGVGPTLYDRFYRPYAEKLWGLPPEALSGEQARRRVAANSPAKLAARILRGARGGDAKGFFYYPRDGFGALWEALADAAVAAGADVRYGATVAGVALDAGGATVTTADGERVRARRVWSTLPLPVLARMADPAPPAAVRAAADALDFRAMVLVYLACEVDRWTPFDAHYLPEGPTPVTRISEPKNYRDGDDPAGRTVLCAEIPCAVGDAAWRADDDALGRLVADTVTDLRLPAIAPAEVVVRRLPAAYPIYRLGYEYAFAALDAWASAQPVLLTFGRQGLFAHDNSHHALAMAWAATDALEARGAFDESAWAAARAVFATHVVED